jgi:hypothetical protein
MKNLKRTGILCIVFFIYSFVASAQQNGWEVIGEKSVDLEADHDEIIVTVFEGTFKAIKFKVLKAPVHVKNFRIFFGNETTENFEINRDFPKGFESEVIDLPGNERIIKKININYRSLHVGKGKAVVVVLGKH